MGKDEKKSRKLKRHPTVIQLTEDQQLAEVAAKDLQKAMKGAGTDEKEIIRVILGNSNLQLQQIKNQYLLLYRQNLEAYLAQNISGKFRDVILNLLKERTIFQAEIMNRAISSIGQDEEEIIEVLCTKNAQELKNLNEGYMKRFKRSLEADVAGVKDGDHTDLFLKLVQGNRKANHGYDIEECKQLAQKLVDATPEGNYIDESVYVEVISNTSFAQLNSVFAIFSELYKDDIKNVVAPRSKGSLKQLLLTMIKCCDNRPRYFAEKIHYALSGIGTRDQALMNIIIARYDIDMPEIKDEYLRLYKSPLWKDIKNDTSGYYEKVLLKLIGRD